MKVYVTDNTNPTHNIWIGKFNESTTTWEWGPFVTVAGSLGFSSPAGVAVDKAGYVYVADNGNHTIQVFDSSGHYQNLWGGFGTAEGLFNSPWVLPWMNAGPRFMLLTLVTTEFRSLKDSGLQDLCLLMQEKTKQSL